ncbi:MAG: type II toxin-antitoxin system PemK/MazF family toxin [Magnetococcales bacterium]|nr:type II toxin-antitoxin system PemK/MazF family toxin [Magnetococcales bacterium]
MKHAGQIALTMFPDTDLAKGKLRPVLLLRRASLRYDDWLVCMISSQLWQAEPDLDVLISTSDHDFPDTGLKVSSIVRISRLTVVDGRLLLGTLGRMEPDRLALIRRRLAAWISANT